MKNDEPANGSLFAIEGPDEEGRVWISSKNVAEDWRRNLGPKESVAETLYSWLGKVDPRRAEAFWTPFFDQEPSMPRT